MKMEWQKNVILVYCPSAYLNLVSHLDIMWMFVFTPKFWQQPSIDQVSQELGNKDINIGDTRIIHCKHLRIQLFWWIVISNRIICMNYYVFVAAKYIKIFFCKLWQKTLKQILSPVPWLFDPGRYKQFVSVC